MGTSSTHYMAGRDRPRAIPTTILRRLLVLSGLSALAVAAPLLDIYGRNPEVFVINRSSPSAMIGFATVVGLVVPVFCWLALWLSSLAGGRAFDLTYLGLLGLLTVAAGLVISRQVTPDSTWLAVTVVILVVVAVVVIQRWAGDLLVWSAVAVPATLGLFLTASPASGLVWSDHEPVEGVIAVENPTSVVMIQLDELPLASLLASNGEVNGDLFPAFARLAEHGTWYRNALADSIATSLAIPASLTGVRGDRSLSPSVLDHPNNLFTMLGDELEMHVIEWVAGLCPVDICGEFVPPRSKLDSMLLDAGVVYLHLMLPAPARRSLPSIDNSWSGFLGQDLTAEPVAPHLEGLSQLGSEAAVPWLDWMEWIIAGVGDGGPRLSYVHLPAPHVPWVTNPSGTRYEAPERYTEVEGIGEGGAWMPNQSVAITGFQRHLYQTGFVDHMLGRLMDRLFETGTWDETMVIVVSDHGASFVAGEHRRWPYHDNRDDLYRIPLFIKYPGQARGDVVDEPAFGIDIVPTVVDVLGVALDWEFDGTSLRHIEGIHRQHQPSWWCCDREGVDPDLRVLAAQVERNHGWVPDQTSWLGVAGVAPYHDLIGRPVNQLPVLSDAGLAWNLNLGRSLTLAEQETGHVQTYIGGRFSTTTEIESDWLLIAVNGRVAGMAWIIRDTPDGGRFGGLIAEELIADGPNRLELLARRTDGMWLQGGLGDVDVTYAAEDGRIIEIEPQGERRAQIDRAEQVGEELVVVGWGADVVAKLAPTMVHIYAGEELLLSSPPNRDNRNVVAWFRSEDLLRSGFFLRVPLDRIPDGIDQVSVVVEFGDGAVVEGANLDLDR